MLMNRYIYYNFRFIAQFITFHIKKTVSYLELLNKQTTNKCAMYIHVATYIKTVTSQFIS